jgi:phage gpG-like protein
MLTLSLDGADAVDARLAAYSSELAASLAARATQLAADLADLVKNDKLSGGVLNSVSGALRDSIEANVNASDTGVTASVGSVGDVKYAAIQEYGGKTAAHEILPSKGQALMFVIGGRTVFARRVEHPGSVIPERSYLRSSLQEMSDEIVAAFAEAPDEAWSRS